MPSSACLGSKTVYWATPYIQTLFIPVKLKYSCWHVPTSVWLSFSFLSGSKASAPDQLLRQKPPFNKFQHPVLGCTLTCLPSSTSWTLTLCPAWTPPSLNCSVSIILHHPPPLADVLLTPLRPLHSALDHPRPRPRHFLPGVDNFTWVGLWHPTLRHHSYFPSSSADAKFVWPIYWPFDWIVLERRGVEREKRSPHQWMWLYICGNKLTDGL